MEPYIIEKRSDNYILFTINRHEKRNAISFEVMDGLEKAINLAKEQNVKALVITGAGESAFCSGGDLSVFHGLKTEEQAYGMLSKMSNILYRLLTLEIPTVALMNGVAVGGGCELAISCDYRIAKEGIKAGFVQGYLAITSGWGGGTMLVEKMQSNHAEQMLMEAKLNHTDKLLQIGFIDSVYSGDSLEACEQFLKNMTDKQVEVLKAYKSILIRKWEQSNLKGRIDEEVRRCAVLWADEAHHEAVANFIAKK
ncbi:enoyl-CoA hydratase/isomerase family protein [Bacillus aquiflavi]|uniref:Ethylmalonyl-CoA decarboxylase n=1 Tax=Bacillus aquiflavi TaxID=2672567 RepID=A0A6B3W314_9BACI|nr:enoyl-CoA hydratase/isomerase family protein [Bacillus aquiflavi]MBA4537627.1 enoyl-CoA hydratase/isomerase family protein [Bacillus aquiflavi]NEY81884.1 enoyl-CoA hydratase/isomerase family protein [Bacillus aquiflavi]UAC49294.1 enoyl-CoA hydratase/isomerase family protein [Bacillus aquiflavi]